MSRVAATGAGRATENGGAGGTSSRPVGSTLAAIGGASGWAEGSATGAGEAAVSACEPFFGAPFGDGAKEVWSASIAGCGAKPWAGAGATTGTPRARAPSAPRLASEARRKAAWLSAIDAWKAVWASAV